MQFLVVGLDGLDDDAPDRRKAVRPAHLARTKETLADGSRWYGAPLLNDDGAMIGSFAVMDVPDRAALDEWLETEPYVQGGVWRTVQVYPCAVREPWTFNKPQEFFESAVRTNADT